MSRKVQRIHVGIGLPANHTFGQLKDRFLVAITIT